ncbi:MAG TPA: DUF4404 family protein [Anaerolineales bacterium]|jgi:hypothetical protein
MSDQKMRELLDQLHDEIAKADKVDEKGSALLRDLDGHIHELMERSDEKPKPAAIASLEDSVRHFEVTHPELTMAISRLLDTLSNAGI